MTGRNSHEILAQESSRARIEPVKKQMTDQLSQPRIKNNIKAHWLGQHVIYYPVVRSTNDILKEMATRGAPAGTLVVADFQSRGKGRHGRHWEAPTGTSLLFTLLFRPNWPAEQANWLTMLAGLACLEAIANQTGLKLSLKWPNDIVCSSQDQWLKVGGLLLEGEVLDGKLDHAVLGIGLNVNMDRNQLPQTEMPASSLSLCLGQYISRLELLSEILKSLEQYYENADQGQSPHQAWNNVLMITGKKVRAAMKNDDQIIEGVAVGTDEWGSLKIRDRTGKIRIFSAGDVTLRS
jgi:BirA family biotin operon repressor/biotin-[acetyl-CoA-carboxylase] ligase